MLTVKDGIVAWHLTNKVAYKFTYIYYYNTL